MGSLTYGWGVFCKCLGSARVPGEGRVDRCRPSRAPDWLAMQRGDDGLAVERRVRRMYVGWQAHQVDLAAAQTCCGALIRLPMPNARQRLGCPRSEAVHRCA